LRSFANAAYSVAWARGGEGETEVPRRHSHIAQSHHRWIGATWLRAYLEGMRGSALLPMDPIACRLLLDALLLERAVYELGHALNHRPERVEMALAGLAELLGENASVASAPPQSSQRA